MMTSKTAITPNRKPTNKSCWKRTPYAVLLRNTPYSGTGTFADVFVRGEPHRDRMPQTHFTLAYWHHRGLEPFLETCVLVPMDVAVTGVASRSCCITRGRPWSSVANGEGLGWSAIRSKSSTDLTNARARCGFPIQTCNQPAPKSHQKQCASSSSLDYEYWPIMDIGAKELSPWS